MNHKNGVLGRARGETRSQNRRQAYLELTREVAHLKITRKERTKNRQVCQRFTERRRSTLCLIVLRPMQNKFSKSVIYWTYRVKNRSQRYNSKIASKVVKLVKNYDHR